MRLPALRRPTAHGPLRIRTATAADAAEVDRLVREVFEEGQWFITAGEEYAGDAAWHRADLERLAREPQSCVLVGHLDGVLVALATARGGQLRRLRHVARVEVFVAAAARDGGVGRAMMEALVDQARAQPLVRKLSLAVFADNTRAVQLYERLGFRVEGRRRGEYREADGSLRDDLLMALDVADAPT